MVERREQQEGHSAGGQSSGVDLELLEYLGIYQDSSSHVYEVFTVHFEAKD